ncbi:hypothetical protein [Salinibacillus xinjiangensis]|uniref:Uncharacterized protein n=1 Tax=Salinibacillus xinjiangensis TaxID=1229268 RepID=A0A6G1X306_9BACI|nr:hypothetical protein [Salinibacillus xinjiangensis]MRG85299.1 hypothetical protein [Salinibacillus xinjiangensis]
MSDDMEINYRFYGFLTGSIVFLFGELICEMRLHINEQFPYAEYYPEMLENYLSIFLFYSLAIVILQWHGGKLAEHLSGAFYSIQTKLAALSIFFSFTILLPGWICIKLIYYVTLGIFDVFIGLNTVLFCCLILIFVRRGLWESRDDHSIKIMV